MELVNWWMLWTTPFLSGQPLIETWGWLIEDGRYGCQIGFGFRRLSDKRLGHLVRFFCGLLGVTGERFLSMTSGVAHSRCPPGSHIGFRFCRLSDERLGRLLRYFCGLLGVSGGRFLSMTSANAHSRWLPYLSKITGQNIELGLDSQLS
jgi:hypothetical protein